MNGEVLQGEKILRSQFYIYQVSLGTEWIKGLMKVLKSSKKVFMNKIFLKFSFCLHTNISCWSIFLPICKFLGFFKLFTHHYNERYSSSREMHRSEEVVHKVKRNIFVLYAAVTSLIKNGKFWYQIISSNLGGQLQNVSVGAQMQWFGFFV